MRAQGQWCFEDNDDPDEDEEEDDVLSAMLGFFSSRESFPASVDFKLRIIETDFEKLETYLQQLTPRWRSWFLNICTMSHCTYLKCIKLILRGPI